MLLPLPALGLAGLFDTLPEVIQQIMWKHELIHLFLGLARIILVVYTVVLEPFGFVNGSVGVGEGNRCGGVCPNRRKLLKLHIG